MCLYPKTLVVTRKNLDYREVVQVNCGKCTECLQQRANEWAFRIMDECKQHSENCALTLTYDNEHLPVGGNVVKRDVQLFIKSLRKAVAPIRIRYFCCGEYGAQFLRPHYHILIFGWRPPDLYAFQRDKKNIMMYRSPMLEKIWKAGFSSVLEVTIETAKYCAKYMQKFNFLVQEKGLEPPFTLMSNRPGIGFNAVNAECLTSDKIYHKGKSIKVPRYYLKVLERGGHDLTEFTNRRILKAQMVGDRDLDERRERSKNFLKQFRQKVLTSSRLCGKLEPHQSLRKR